MLEVEFLDRISEPVREGKAGSISDIIRTALERYDFANVIVLKPSQLQISVRLSAPIRQNLRRIARTKHTSIGQLVRAAVEAYLPQLETGAINQLEIPAVPSPAPAEPVLAPRPNRRKRKRKPVKQKSVAKKKPARRKRQKA